VTRAQFAVVLLVVAVSGFLGGAVSDRLKGRPAYADLTEEDASKPYLVTFEDWVVVYLHARFETSGPDYFVGTGVRQVGGKVRFTIKGSAADTPLGREWYAEVGSKIEDSVAQKCEIWTLQGYPISLSDFEISIEKP